MYGFNTKTVYRASTRKAMSAILA